MFRAIKRVFIWLGLMAEKATETDAINQAVVERGIRDSKTKADKAHYANGQLAGQIALLKDQIKRQDRQREDLQGMLQADAAANDEANGAHYAEELAALEQDLGENKAQLDSLEQLYKQNTEIIAQSLREIQKFQREFEAVKARVAIGRSLENLAGMMKSSITELQGMMGGELAQSMQQLRQSAASGEGQMRATLDLAKEMGSGIARQQEMRKARGAMLFQEFKKKMDASKPAPEKAAADVANKLLAGEKAVSLVDGSAIPPVSGVSDYDKPMKDGKLIVQFPINIWPGWAPIIVANNGLEPNDGSVFYKKYGFYLKLAIVDDPVQARDLFARGHTHIL